MKDFKSIALAISLVSLLFGGCAGTDTGAGSSLNAEDVAIQVFSPLSANCSDSLDNRAIKRVIEFGGGGGGGGGGLVPELPDLQESFFLTSFDSKIKFGGGGGGGGGGGMVPDLKIALQTSCGAYAVEVRGSCENGCESVLAELGSETAAIQVNENGEFGFVAAVTNINQAIQLTPMQMDGSLGEPIYFDLASFNAIDPRDLN